MVPFASFVQHKLIWDVIEPLQYLCPIQRRMPSEMHNGCTCMCECRTTVCRKRVRTIAFDSYWAKRRKNVSLRNSILWIGRRRTNKRNDQNYQNNNNNNFSAFFVVVVLFSSSLSLGTRSLVRFLQFVQELWNAYEKQTRWLTPTYIYASSRSRQILHTSNLSPATTDR